MKGSKITAQKMMWLGKNILNDYLICPMATWEKSTDCTHVTALYPFNLLLVLLELIFTM